MVGVTLWARGLRQVKPVVQFPLLFSAWLDCNFLGFGEQDTLPCTQENRPDVHLVPVCGQKIKDTHSHMCTHRKHRHHLPPEQKYLLATIMAATFKKYNHNTLKAAGVTHHCARLIMPEVRNLLFHIHCLLNYVCNTLFLCHRYSEWYALLYFPCDLSDSYLLYSFKYIFWCKQTSNKMNAKRKLSLKLLLQCSSKRFSLKLLNIFPVLKPSSRSGSLNSEGCVTLLLSF